MYTKAAINKYALYHAVKVVDNDENAYYGWLVPFENWYMVLPFNTYNRVYLKIRDIKAIYHLTNGALIPKKVKE